MYTLNAFEVKKKHALKKSLKRLVVISSLPMRLICFTWKHNFLSLPTPKRENSQQTNLQLSTIAVPTGWEMPIYYLANLTSPVNIFQSVQSTWFYSSLFPFTFTLNTNENNGRLATAVQSLMRQSFSLAATPDLNASGSSPLLQLVLKR